MDYRKSSPECRKAYATWRKSTVEVHHATSFVAGFNAALELIQKAPNKTRRPAPPWPCVHPFGFDQKLFDNSFICSKCGKSEKD